MVTYKYCFLLLLVCATPILVKAEEKCGQVGIHSKECLIKLFNSRLDTSVNPCDDFYQYSCGTYINNTKLDGAKRETVFHEIGREIEALFKADLMKKVANTDQSPMGKAKRMFQSCMAPNRSMETTKMFEEQIKKTMGGFPVKKLKNKANSLETFTDLMIKFRKAGIEYDYIIKSGMTMDIKNPTKYLLKLSQGSLTLGGKDSYNNTNNRTKAYLSFAVGLAERFCANKNEATQEMKLVLDFETKISELFLSVNQLSKEDEIYNKMSINSLGQEVKGIDWSKLLNAIVGQKLDTRQKVLNVATLNYVKGAIKVISETEPRVIANYFILRHSLKMVKFLDGEYERLWRNYDEAINGINKPRKQLKTCIRELKGCLLGTLSSHFAKKYYSPKIKEIITGIVDDIKEIYIDYLRNSDWMSQETIVKAVEKANAITASIGYPDEIIKPGVIEKFCAETTITENFFENIHEIAKAMTLNEFSVYGKTVKKNDWTRYDIASHTVNAFYYPNGNSITLLAGVTQGLIYSPSRPMALNYGTVGSIVGHELAHAFDSEGRKYDKEGLATNWWSPQSNSSFVKRSQCLVDLYSSHKYPGLDKYTNGAQILGENVADVMGIEVGYLALEKYLKKNEVKKHKAFHSLSDRQLFWSGWGQMWCEVANKNFREWAHSDKSHCPNPLRVTVPFKNSKNFAKDYNCPVDSKMYTNPKDKCQF